LLDIKATLAATKQNVVIAENNLYLSKLSLAQLLQLEDFQNFDVDDTVPEVKGSGTMLENPVTIYKKAKEERVELKIAKTNLLLAEKMF